MSWEGETKGMAAEVSPVLKSYSFLVIILGIFCLFVVLYGNLFTQDKETRESPHLLHPENLPELL